MSKTVPAIRGVKARGLITPISRPVKNALGVIDAAPMVLIDVDTDLGVTGRAYETAKAGLLAMTRMVIDSKLPVLLLSLMDFLNCIHRH